MPRVFSIGFPYLRALGTKLFAVFPCLFFTTVLCAQSPQPHYLAYATFSEPDPTQGYQAVPIAANSAGQVCAFNGRALLEIKPDGTLAYFRAISSISAFVKIGPILAMTIDSADNCYVTGIGTITPTPGAYQSNKSSGMYVVKLDLAANVLLATYLGGSGRDTPGSIALDPSGNIWVAGSTTSNDLPVSPNAIQSSFQGGTNDAFVAELNPKGTQLLYGTYLGGNGTDANPTFSGTAGVTLAVDEAGDVLITGDTTSTNFPLHNPLETSGSSYVTKLSNAGQVLYSTLFGLTSGANAVSIASDPTGNAYITGQADSGLPLVNPIPNQGIGAFVAKLSADGSSLIYSTYYGGGPGGNVSGVIPYAIQVDTQGNATIAGIGGAAITLVDPIQENTGLFLASLDPNGNLVFSSDIGSGLSDGGQMALAVDSNGSVYLGTQAGTYLPFPPLQQPIYGIERPFFCTGQCLEGYIAKVSAGSAPSFSMPANVQFGSEDVGVQEGAALVFLFNTGTTTIAINSFTTTGDFAVFQNQCPTTFIPSTTCSVAVTFTPTAGGIRNGTLVIADDSPGNPHVIQLTGTGLAPNASVNPNSLTFSAQGVKTTSPPQNVSLTDTGTSALSISRITIVGTDAGDFAETNNCGLSINAGASCAIAVTFTPTALGTRTATLSITDAVGTQTAALSGTGSTSLGLSVASGSSDSATVSAGSTASYTLSIGGGGLSGSATLTCSGAPTGATCTVPASENVSANTASTFTVTVTTTARSSAALRHRISPSAWFWATILFGIVSLPVRRRPRRKLRAVLPLSLILFIVSCGGGNGGSGSSGTPSGTYNLTVTATMGSTNQTQMLKLTVQ